MRKIRPFLWFDDQAREAAHFYVSLFENARILDDDDVDEADGEQNGAFTSISFELEGVEYIAFNGGPFEPFSPAVSFFISCETQAEVDRLWRALIDGGAAQRCGWIRDRFGLTWQIVPTILPELLSDADPARAGRARDAMLTMEKLDIAALLAAADGESPPS